MSVLLVSGLGRNISSPPAALLKGVETNILIFPILIKGNDMFSLRSCNNLEIIDQVTLGS